MDEIELIDLYDYYGETETAQRLYKELTPEQRAEYDARVDDYSCGEHWEVLK